MYDVTSGPTSEMKDEASLKALSAFYSVPNTPDFENTKDLFARSLPIKNPAEFERRIKTTIDPMLIKYSDGEITKDEYMKYVGEQRQQAQQQQVQMMQQQQQYVHQEIQLKQGALAQKGQADEEKAQSTQFNDETKRMKTLSDIQTAETQTYINMAEIQGDQEMKQADHEIEQQHNQLEIAKLANQQYKEQRELNAA